MAINLELPRKLQAVIVKTHQGAAEMMRPIARKYDLKEHAYPVELDTLITLFEGAAESFAFAGADALRDEDEGRDKNHNGGNMAALLQTLEASWGDVAMMLSIPVSGPGQRRHLRGGHRRATGAPGQGVGRDGHHRAGLRVGLGGGVRRPPPWTATST